MINLSSCITIPVCCKDKRQGCSACFLLPPSTQNSARSSLVSIGPPGYQTRGSWAGWIPAGLPLWALDWFCSSAIHSRGWKWTFRPGVQYVSWEWVLGPLKPPGHGVPSTCLFSLALSSLAGEPWFLSESNDVQTEKLLGLIHPNSGILKTLPISFWLVVPHSWPGPCSSQGLFFISVNCSVAFQ